MTEHAVYLPGHPAAWRFLRLPPAAPVAPVAPVAPLLPVGPTGPGAPEICMNNSTKIMVLKSQRIWNKESLDVLGIISAHSVAR